MLTIFIILPFFVLDSIHAQNNTAKPKLVIGLVVDQMRWDHLHRFSHHYGEGGFKRLMKEGFSFENAVIPYAPTMTAAGHASIYTGSIPAIHGIVGNEWIERNTGKYTYCADDPDVAALGGSNTFGKMSPVKLLATTVGDEMKISSNFRSKVFGVSLKDRGGIFPAGRAGDAAYWLDDSTGNWVTSTWYMKALPAWVNKFNARRDIDSMMKKGWNLLLSHTSYNLTRPDANEFEIPIANSGTTHFPHELNEFVGKSYTPFRYIPMGNTLTLEFSKSLIDEEQLGFGKDTDMLCISLSSTDYIGHKFGPFSLEAEDAYLRLDRDIDAFLQFLDKKFGKGEYLLFLTADHAAPAIPAFLKSKNLSAGNLDNYGLVKMIDNQLSKKFKYPGLVTHYFNNQFFLNHQLMDSLGLTKAEIRGFVIDFLNGIEEVVMAFDYSKLNEMVLPAATREVIARGYYPKRCGDILVILKPQFTDYINKGTEHGTFYNYDTHVPMLFFGKDIRRGRSHRRVGVTDIAPTLCALLQIQMPNGSIGVVLGEIVQE